MGAESTSCRGQCLELPADSITHSGPRWPLPEEFHLSIRSPSSLASRTHGAGIRYQGPQEEVEAAPAVTPQDRPISGAREHQCDPPRLRYTQDPQRGSSAAVHAQMGTPKPASGQGGRSELSKFQSHSLPSTPCHPPGPTTPSAGSDVPRQGFVPHTPHQAESQ